MYITHKPSIDYSERIQNKLEEKVKLFNRPQKRRRLSIRLNFFFFVSMLPDFFSNYEPILIIFFALNSVWFPISTILISLVLDLFCYVCSRITSLFINLFELFFLRLDQYSSRVAKIPN